MLTSPHPGRLQVLAALVLGVLVGYPAAAGAADFSAKQRVAPLAKTLPQTSASASASGEVQSLTTKVRVAPLSSDPSTPLATTPASQATVAAEVSQPLAPATTPATPLVAGPVEPTASLAPSLASGPVAEPEPLVIARREPPPSLNSTVALVMDQNTQQVLLRKNDTAVVPIASLTKMMTGLVIADARLNMKERIRITSADVDRLKNSGSRLAVGARLTREEALHLALMSSENRAAHALARTFPGGEDRFVRLMNAKAAELGMRDTHFVDPTGLSSLNRSSARDLARLAAAATERPLLRDLSTSPSYEVALGRRVVQYRNSNRLIQRDDWDIGLQKTGYIREAGRCLLMQVNVAGRQLIMVLLDAAGPAARLGDAERVRRWAEALIDGVGEDQGSPLAVKRRPSV